MTPIEIGSPAPKFTLPRDGGDTVSLASLLGQKTVLFFNPKDNTPGCTTEAIDFTNAKKQFDKLGAIIVGMSPDTPKKHDNFKTKHGLDVVLVSDEQKNTLEAYGVWVEKSMYGRKYMGVERSTFLIDENGIVTRIWRKVKVKGHVDDVLAALEAVDDQT
jgi:peroxiredoxin Q/BCP